MRRQFRQNFIIFLAMFFVAATCAAAASEAPTPEPTITVSEVASTDTPAPEPQVPTEAPTETPTDTPAPVSPTEAVTATPEITAGITPEITSEITEGVTPEPTVSTEATPSPEASPTVTGNPTPTATKAPTPTPYVTVIPPDEEKDYYVTRTDVEASVGKLSTVRVDGRKETFWGYCETYVLNNVILGESDTQVAFQTAWDSEYLYLYIEVTDTTYDVSSELFTRKDGIEIFLNESNARTTYYDKGDQHYQIARDGSIHYGNGAAEDLIRYKVVESEDGYVAEVAIAFVLWEGKRGTELGLDIRVNDSFGTGARDYIVQWSDTTLLTYTDLSKIGTITLR